jgi:hypothetical protein
MKPLRSILFMAATLAYAAQPSLGQEKGKTPASELASASQKALSQLQAEAPLAKELTPKAHAILVFPKVRRPASWPAARSTGTRCTS